MKSTQKNQNKPNEKKNDWQMPEKSQVFLTPGAQKSLEDAERKGEKLRVVHDRPQARKVPPAPSPTPQKKAEEQKAAAPRPEKKSTPAENVSLKDAVIAELRDRLRVIRLSIQVNSEDIIKGCVCGVAMIFFALLQTTFFVRFAPFSKVPDLMLVFVLAVGVCEGEKWGCVTALFASFLIEALGGSGAGPELLPLVYMPVGCVAGILSKYYLRHTLPVNAVYIAVAAFLRGIVTFICASVILDASPSDIILKIALPEYFSTLAVSPLPFLTVWLSLRPFHKTRAERTDHRAD